MAISINTLLSAILLPSLSQTQWQTALIQCISIQKQLGVAYATYNTDNDRIFPSYYVAWGRNPHEIPSVVNYEIIFENCGMTMDTFFSPVDTATYNTETWLTQSGDPNRDSIEYFVLIPRPRLNSLTTVPFSNIGDEGDESLLGPSYIGDFELANKPDNGGLVHDCTAWEYLGAGWGDGRDYLSNPESINLLYADGRVESERNNAWNFEYTSLNLDIWN